jgi:predicted nucleic acid-binding protein
MVVIADTSALNYLVLIEQINVLEKIYGTVVIPETVRNELLHSTAPEPVREWIVQAPEWLRVRTPRNRPDPSLSALDAGERDAITLALELHAKQLIIDDRQGRESAIQHGIPVIGTLGILRAASELGLLDLRATLARLRATNFYVTEEQIRKLLWD